MSSEALLDTDSELTVYTGTGHHAIPAVQGLEGWLFDARAVQLLAGSEVAVPAVSPVSGSSSGKIADIQAEPAAIAAAWFEQLADNTRWLAEQGARYVHLCVPEKFALLAEFSGSELGSDASSPMQQLSARYRSQLPCLLDPSAYLRHQKVQQHPLYWKADTRWSPWACYMTYQLLCGKLGVELNKQLLGYPYSEASQPMNLDADHLASEPQVIRHYRLHMRSKRRFANKLAIEREVSLPVNNAALSYDCYGSGSHTVFENRHADASMQTIMLFGDANSSDGRTLLTGMLAETFAEVHFVWSPVLDKDYIVQVKPDIVISQASELQMARLPVQSFDIRASADASLQNLERDAEALLRCADDAHSLPAGTAHTPASHTRVILASEEYGLDPPGFLQENGGFSDIETRMRTNEVSLTDVTDATVYFTGPDWHVHDAKGGEVLRHQSSASALPRSWRWGRHRKLSGVTLMFGTSAGAHCYYHWMLELLPKLGLLEREGISLDSIDHFLVRKISGDWQRQTLARFGIDASRIVETEQQPRWRCDRLLHVDINCGINLKMHRFIPQWMKHLYAPDQSGLPRLRLYITRPAGVRRGISNETEIIPLLKDAGFTMMAMEGLSVAEQAALLSRADVLMSPHGGALTNMVFCRPGITVIEMFSRHVFPYYYGLAANCGHHYHAILENPLEDYPRLVNSRIAQLHADNQHETAELAFKVPVEAVRQLLEQL